MIMCLGAPKPRLYHFVVKWEIPQGVIKWNMMEHAKEIQVEGRMVSV